MNISRRGFVGSTAAFAAVGRVFASDEKPILKVGFITDTHVGWTKKSCERVKGAFEIFRQQGVDAIGHCGDLADWHYADGYKYYREVLDEAYAGAKMPELLYVYANHDLLDPTKKGQAKRFYEDYEAAFRDMQQRLKIDHWLLHTPVINGIPFLIFPQTERLVGGLTAIEEKLKEIYAKFPTGPIVVMTHLAPMHTVYNSGEWGSLATRRILNKYPRVVSFTGHTHGSLRNEQSIWQGEFTAVDVCCLQEWHGVSVGTPLKSKQAYGAIVAEFYPGRLVIRRFDVRDGSEYKANDPWIVPLPFDAKAAPYDWKKCAAREKKATFAAGAKLTVTVEADGVKVSFPTSRDEDQVLYYKVTVARKAAGGRGRPPLPAGEFGVAGGTWENYARADLFSEFYKRPADRVGKIEHTYPAPLFDSGEMRVCVTPVGFFGTEGTVLETCVTIPARTKGEVVFASEKPMEEVAYMSGWKNEAPLKPNKEGYYHVTCGRSWLELPDGIWKGPAGARYIFTADVSIKQRADIDGVCMRLQEMTGARRGVGSWMTTPSGEGRFRVVFDVKMRDATPPNYKFSVDRVTDYADLRFERVCVERMEK